MAKVTPPTAETRPAEQAHGIAVGHTWAGGNPLDAVVQSIEVADLGFLFAGQGELKEDLWPHPEITIYPGIAYLMSRGEAESKLVKDGSGVKARSQIVCSGFPGGLTVFAYDVKIGSYNRACLVADQADQVVAVELVAQHAFQRPPQPMPGQWHVIDYANQEVKGKPSIVVFTQFPVMIGGCPAAVTAANLGNGQRTVAWFVPRPLINLIRLCVAYSQKHPL